MSISGHVHSKYRDQFLFFIFKVYALRKVCFGWDVPSIELGSKPKLVNLLCVTIEHDKLTWVKQTTCLHGMKTELKPRIILLKFN